MGLLTKRAVFFPSTFDERDYLPLREGIVLVDERNCLVEQSDSYCPKGASARSSVEYKYEQQSVSDEREASTSISGGPRAQLNAHPLRQKHQSTDTRKKDSQIFLFLAILAMLRASR
jgi:hypothetical protein